MTGNLRFVLPGWALRRCVVAAASLALGACGFFLSEDDRIARALEAQERGDLRAATIELKSLLEKNPNHAAARFRLGAVSLQQGDAAVALRELTRARELKYESPELDETLARAHFVLGEFDRALQLIDAKLGAASTALTPEQRVQWLGMRADVLASQRRFDEAKSAFDEALVIAPEHVPALLGLARVLAASQELKAAIDTANKALAIAPKNPDAHATLGSLQTMSGDTAAAIDAFQTALALSAGPAQQLKGLSGLAQAQLEAGKVADALATTERMQQLAPNSQTTRYMRALALVRDGQLDTARELLEKNAVNESDVPSRVLLGAVNLAQGRLGQAEMYLASAVAAVPDNAMARQLLAEARLRQAKPGDALDALAPAIASAESGAPADANLLALAARASVAAGKPAQGVEYLQRNVQAQPQNMDARLNLAAGYLAAGMPDKALAELERAGSDAPGESEASKTLSDAQALRREYLAVLARFNQGDPTGAVKHAAAVADASPNNPSLQALASSAFAMQGQFDRARKYAQAVLKLRPDDASAYVALGRIDLQQGQSESAAENFRIALARQPGNITAAVALAMVDFAARRYDASIETIDAALKRAPASLELLVLKGEVLVAKGDLQTAEQLARTAVESAPESGAAQALLGRVLTLRGQYAQAVEALTRAAGAAPRSAAVRHQLAVAQRAAGNAREALASVNESLRIDERYIPAILLGAQLQLSAGDLTAAERHIDALMKLAPEQGVSHALLGELRFAERRYADAVKAFQKAGQLSPSGVVAAAEYRARKAGNLTDPTAPLTAYLRTHPNDVAALLALAQDRQTSGKLQEAAEAYERIVAQQPDHVVALNNLAWLRFEAGDRDAVKLAKRAYELAPKSAEVADTYAWILIGTGDSAAGLKLLEPFLGGASGASKQGVSAEIVAHYAVALAEVGRSADARRAAQSITAEQLRTFDARLQSKVQPLMR